MTAESLIIMFTILIFHNQNIMRQVIIDLTFEESVGKLYTNRYLKTEFWYFYPFWNWRWSKMKLSLIDFDMVYNETS